MRDSILPTILVTLTLGAAGMTAVLVLKEEHPIALGIAIVVGIAIAYFGWAVGTAWANRGSSIEIFPIEWDAPIKTVRFKIRNGPIPVKIVAIVNESKELNSRLDHIHTKLETFGRNKSKVDRFGAWERGEVQLLVLDTHNKSKNPCLSLVGDVPPEKEVDDRIPITRDVPISDQEPVEIEVIVYYLTFEKAKENTDGKKTRTRKVRILYFRMDPNPDAPDLLYRVIDQSN